MDGAANLAYQAVRKPVEGTILTVAREAARAAETVYNARPRWSSSARKSIPTPP